MNKNNNNSDKNKKYDPTLLLDRGWYRLNFESASFRGVRSILGPSALSAYIQFPNLFSLCCYVVLSAVLHSLFRLECVFVRRRNWVEQVGSVRFELSLTNLSFCSFSRALIAILKLKTKCSSLVGVWRGWHLILRTLGSYWVFRHCWLRHVILLYSCIDGDSFWR